MIFMILFDVFFVWSIIGFIWAISYDVHLRGDILYHKYKTVTIVLGGPFWWIIFLIDYFRANKEKFRPRTKIISRKRITSLDEFKRKKNNEKI